jgi:hypothetical protein
VVLLVTLGILTFRKGHWVLGLIGFLFPVLWLVGSHPARPPPPLTSSGDLAAAVLRIRPSRCSPTRMALAMAVRAGFTAPMLGKKLVSTT